MAAAGLYAMSNACMGATPVAYASDVMPSGLGGFGLGIYRCAGDLGELGRFLNCHSCRPVLYHLTTSCT